MIFIVAYLSFHFLAYAFFLRRLSVFYEERSIFLFHAISFGTVFGLSLAAVSFQSLLLTEAAGVIALHGIYSLSFLELWALSDGGYSLRILDQIDRRPDSIPNFGPLKGLGASKKQYRLDSLKQLGFLRTDAQGWGITLRGRAAAAFLNFFVGVSKQKGRH